MRNVVGVDLAIVLHGFRHPLADALQFDRQAGSAPGST